MPKKTTKKAKIVKEPIFQVDTSCLQGLKQYQDLLFNKYLPSPIAVQGKVIGQQIGLLAYKDFISAHDKYRPQPDYNIKETSTRSDIKTSIATLSKYTELVEYSTYNINGEEYTLGKRNKHLIFDIDSDFSKTSCQFNQFRKVEVNGKRILPFEYYIGQLLCINGIFYCIATGEGVQDYVREQHSDKSTNITCDAFLPYCIATYRLYIPYTKPTLFMDIINGSNR